MAPATSDLIAFYGTLMLRAEHRLDEVGLEGHFEYVGPCRIPGQLYHLGHYPGLVPGDGEVPGELHRIRDFSALAVLDEFEEVDWENPETSLYHRWAIQLVEPEVMAWVYLYNRSVEGLPRLAAWDR